MQKLGSKIRELESRNQKLETECSLHREALNQQREKLFRAPAGLRE